MEKWFLTLNLTLTQKYYFNKKNYTMKNTIITTILASMILFSISSCKKEDTTDTEKPVITIVDPTTSVTYNSGDEVHFKFEITDNDEIHEIEAMLIKEHMGMKDTVWSKHDHPDAAEHTMHGHYTIGTVMHADFSVIVKATDHTGNKATATTAFHVMN